MTTTPNPTAESVIAEAMVNAGAPLMHSRVEESVAAALRANNLLSEGAPSEEQIERAARAIRADYVQRYPEEPPVYHAGAGQPVWRHMARAALGAAGVAPQEVIDDAADEQDDLRLHMLAAQEPLAIDPEKVAEVIEQMRDRARKEHDVTKESLGQFISRALCEAYTEGRLT